MHTCVYIKVHKLISTIQQKWKGIKGIFWIKGSLYPNGTGKTWNKKWDKILFSQSSDKPNLQWIKDFNVTTETYKENTLGNSRSCRHNKVILKRISSSEDNDKWQMEFYKIHKLLCSKGSCQVKSLGSEWEKSSVLENMT